MNQLHDIRAFVEVARSGSFLKAGNAIGQTSSAVSKAIRRLEAALDVRLLTRTTRRLILTDEGQKYLQDCERILQEFQEATDAVSRRKASAAGNLRVQLPFLWGRDELLPTLSRFYERYPSIRIEFIFNERKLDMMEERIDVAVRVGLPRLPELVAKPLLPTRAMIVVSPSYLQRKGTPKNPDELEQHVCLPFLDPQRSGPMAWVFQRGGRSFSRSFDGPLLFNYPPAMRDAAIAGLGLVQGPDFLFADAIRRGKLVEVLEGWTGAGPPICIIWPQNRYLTQRARVFIDWLTALAKP